MIRRYTLLLLLGPVLLSPAASAQLSLTWEPVAIPNLPLSIEVFRADEPAPLDFLGYMVRADTVQTAGIAERDWVFAVEHHAAGRTVAQHAAAYYGRALVALNGGYFGGGQSYSLAMDEGVLFASNIAQITRDGLPYYPTRAAFGWTARGDFDAAWTYNVDGAHFAYPEPSPNAPQMPQPRPGATFPAGAEYFGIVDAIGGGPMLVQDGEVRITWTEEVFFGGSGVDTTATRARSAIGVDHEGRLLLFSTRENRGATLREVAEIMRDFGAREAMNLDGGGSSALWAGGSYLIPSSRAVVTAVVLRAASPFDPLVLDNDGSAGYLETGAWFDSAQTPVYGGTPSRLNEVGVGDDVATFRVNNNNSYFCADMEAWWTPGSNRATDTPFRLYYRTIYEEQLTVEYRVDQSDPSTANRWNSIGWVQGLVDSVRVGDDALGMETPAYVSVDAIRFVQRFCPSVQSGPDAFIALDVSPNPARTAVSIAFDVVTPGAVSVAVFDMLGRRVQSVTQERGTGPQTVELSLAGLPAGVYSVTVQTRDGRASRRISRLP